MLVQLFAVSACSQRVHTGSSVMGHGLTAEIHRIWIPLGLLFSSHVLM